MNFFEKLLHAFAPKVFSLAEENNIVGILDDTFLLTKNENLVCAIALGGRDYIHLSEEQMTEAFASRVLAFNKLTAGISMKIFIRRRKILYQKQYDIACLYAKKIIEQWEQNKEAYANSYYLIMESSSNLKTFLEQKKTAWTTSAKVEAKQANFTALSKRNALLVVRDRIMQTLESYQPQALSATQTLELFAGYMNGFEMPLHLHQGLLSDSYLASEVRFEKDYYVQNFNGREVFRRIISLKEFDTESIDSLVISNLLHRDFELDILLHLEPLGKEKALLKLNNKLKLSNRLAKEKIFELIEKVKAEYVILQYVSLHILPLAKSKEILNHWTESISTDMVNYGFVPVVETLNLLAQFFSFFPDRSYLNPRKRLQTSINAGTLVLFEKEEQGFVRNSWGDSPLTLFKTQSLNYYLFNLHAQESRGGEKMLGHTLIIGATGSGKTTLMSFLMMNCLKYNIDVLSLDRLNGMAIATEFFEGEYNSGEEFFINPFSLEDNQENREFLASWLKMLLGLREESLQDIPHISNITHAIDTLYSVMRPQGDFGLKDFLDALEYDKEGILQMQLQRYLKNPIFNQLKDCLEFKKPITTLNMDFIVHAPKDASLVAYYLFHKMIYRGKAEGRGFFMFIDEFRSYTDNEMMNEKINLALTQARKVNGVLAIALQDINQLHEVKNAASYIQNMGHIILFPQPNINFAELYAQYGLKFTQVEQDFLLHTRSSERKILVKNQMEHTSSILDIDFTNLGKYLPIFSSDSTKVLKMRELQKHYGSKWREEYLKEMQI